MKLTAPFTDDNVRAINDYQDCNYTPTFTCCSHQGCDRINQSMQGKLVAHNDFLICPCGKYTQKWVHDFMVDKVPQNPMDKYLDDK